MKYRKTLKDIYKHIPLKKQLFTVIKAIFPNLDPKYRSYFTFGSRFNVNLDKDKSFKVFCNYCTVETDLFWSGYGSNWEMQSLLVWKMLVKDATNIIDIGANTGIYSLVAATLNPQAKIVAFEPMPRVFDKLKKNIECNHFSQVKYENMAVSNYNGKATMFDLPDSDHTYGGTVNENLYKTEMNTKSINVEVCKLDSYVKENGINKVDLVKIDVESHEKSVLEGMEEIMYSHKPIILFEVWDFSELQKDLGTEINEYFKKFDYNYYYSDDVRSFEKIDRIFSNKEKSNKNYQMFLVIPQGHPCNNLFN